MIEVIGFIIPALPFLFATMTAFLIANATAGYLVTKDAITRLAAVTAALDDAMQTAVEALDDDAVTEEEYREIFQRVQVVWRDAQALTGILANTGVGQFISGLFTGLFRSEYRIATKRWLFSLIGR